MQVKRTGLTVLLLATIGITFFAANDNRLTNNQQTTEAKPATVKNAMSNRSQKWGAVIKPRPDTQPRTEKAK
uniref:Uncharacterized protein n=2 Tax=Pseudoalteromonas rubra TaxID=43658 RepID=A0A0F4QXR1_9GAMM|nr:hypothetical protein TW77_03390 [Pseudoalteromonas rubra]